MPRGGKAKPTITDSEHHDLPLDQRETEFVKYKLAGMNNTQAALKAGYAPASAANMGSVLMRRMAVREALGITLRQLGITFEQVIKPITDGLVATRKVVVGRGKNAHTEEMPDYKVRLAAASMAWKMLQYEADNTTPSTFEPDADKLLPNARDAAAAPEDKPAADEKPKPDAQSDELLERIKNMDEVELANVVFNKPEQQTELVTNSK